MLNFLFSILLFTYGGNIQTEPFEGSIDLVYISQYDTTYLSFFVKQNNVRVDKFDKNHKHVESVIMNLKKENIYVVSPSRKLYTEVNYISAEKSKDNKFEVLKAENTRSIIGQDCFQWRVKNIERNTEICYWVANNGFDFFEKFVILYSSVDKMYEFYEKIPDTRGYFPLLVEERTLLRADKSKLMVQKISNRILSQSFFDIPSDYEKVNR